MNWPGFHNPANKTQLEHLIAVADWLAHVTDRMILPALARIEQNQGKLMNTLADVQAAVTAEDTVIDSAMALLTGLAAQVAALAPDQAAIDALATDIKGKSDALAAAVAANTPAA